MRFLKLLTPLIKIEDINASLRSYPKEYIQSFHLSIDLCASHHIILKLWGM